jgi:multiple sugar transport system permease protein
VLIYVPLAIGAVGILLPFIWMVATSLKTEGQIFSNPAQLLPSQPTVQAYIDVWRRIPFGRFFINSVIFAGSVTIVSLFLDSMAAYAFARLRFKGRDILFWVVLATLMVPFQITLIPLFLTVFHLGWLDTYQGLIVPRATNAFGIFLLRQFFLTLPPELDDAARIDGAGEFRIYWQIILPLSLPALATLAVFHFMYNWNDFLWPLIITSSPEMRTLPAGLTLFMGNYVIEHAILMAGATISLLPLAIAFVFLQRYFVRGVAMTGLK